MRRIVTLAFLFSSILNSQQSKAQGFSLTSLNWQLPERGLYDFHHDFGYSYISSQGTPRDSSRGWSTIDINGDQKPDLVLTSYGTANTRQLCFGAGTANQYWEVYLNTGNGFSTTAIQWSLPSGGKVFPAYSPGFASLTETLAFYSGSQRWNVKDMNGDGKPDLVVTAESNGSFAPCFGTGTSNQYWKVYLNNGAGFDQNPLIWNMPAGIYIISGNDLGYFCMKTVSNSSLNSFCWDVQDINGDAKPDLIITSVGDGSNAVCFDATTSNQHWNVHLNNGSGFDPSPISWSLPSGGYHVLNDFFGFWSLNQLGYSTIDCDAWNTIDMNGDDKPDLVVSGRADGIYLNCFGAGTANQYWNVYINNGTGFNINPVIWNLPPGGYIINSHLSGFHELESWGNSTEINSQGWDTEDINADGKPDLIVLAEADGIYNYCFDAAVNPYWKIYLNNGNGFSLNPVTWTIPGGGYITKPDLAELGFIYTDYDNTLTTHAGNSWSMLDLNGDNAKDLVLTSELSPAFYQDCFGAGTPAQHWKVYLNNMVTTGIDQNTSTNKKTNVFPNPFENKFTINIPGDFKNEKYSIIDPEGKIISDGIITNENTVVDFSAFAAGMYFIQIGKEKNTIKIVKQ